MLRFEGFDSVDFRQHRRGECLCCGAGGDDAPLFQCHQPVTEPRGEAEVVQDDDHAAAGRRMGL